MTRFTGSYFMPIRRTRLRKELDQEFTTRDEMAFFNDTKPSWPARGQADDRRSWAEDPPSRTRRVVTNVRVTPDDGAELSVESNFLLYRTRLGSQEDKWIGSRQDVLRRQADTFLIAGRTILLEETVVLSRNMSNFF